MKIAFNPSTVAALTTPPNNKDITFDLRGHSIFARGVEFKGTDTNTWRDIKINNVSIGSHTLDLRNGSNTTLTNTNGVVTINSTWRPVVDNLTSDSTISSLSAKQGKVLKALIDGKSNSDHNHDGRYVRYYAVTTLDCNNLAAGLTAARISATNAAHTNHSAYLYISDVGTPFQIQIPDSSIPYIYKRYYGSGKWSGWFKLNAGYADSAGSVAWANVTGKPSSYTPSAHTHAWNSLTHSSTTENQAILTNGKANGWKLQTLNIARWDNAANNAHSHANKSVLDGITSALVNSWNTAYNFVSNITGTDTDKVINKWEEIVNFLAGITEDNKLNTLLNSKLSVYELADNTNVGTIKNNGIYYSTTDASSRTLINSPFNTGFAFINMTSYDGGDDLRRSRLAFNAFGEIKVSDDRDQANTAETWYNVLTSKNSGINGSTIKLNGTSITVYSSGTADGRYVKKSGDTMSGVLTIDTPNFGALTIKRNDDANGASIQFRGKSSVYGYIGLNNSTKDKQFLRWSSDTSRIYTILDTSSTYISNGKGVINGTTITQVDNATNSTNSTNARKLVNWYSARPTSLNAQFGDGSLRIFYATSSTTEGKPAEDSHILHLAWDNTGGYDAQLAVHARSGKVSTRAQNGGTWQPWKTLAFTTDIPTSLKNPYSFNVFGVVYDGSAAKTVTTSTFVSQLPEGTSTVTDGTMFITSWASNSGFADTNAVNVPYKRKAIYLWEYIKAKTDSLYATNGHNHDGKYLKLTGGTMLGALNFANNTWNLVGDDSYIGDCNISGHFGIKAANTTYPGITFFNNASTFLGNLTAYSGNIKYGAYSLQFLDNGNTSVSASTWTNPFSNYNSNAVADGQAICVWGQSSYLSNLSTDTGGMSLWLKRINANVATLNMVLDGEYYANGNQRLAHVSEIPNKDSWNYDDRYLRLTGGWMSGDINFGGDKKIYWGRNTDSASISFKNDGDGDANSYMSFVTSDNGNEYFRWSHSSGSTNTEWMALRSDGLRVRGTKVSLEGHTHDDRYYTKAESNAKYITDITTSVNKLTFTRNGSNIARNITVNVVYSQGNLTDISNKDNTTKASSGLYIYNSYNQVIGTNSYSSVLSINTGGTIQIAGNWGDDQTRNLYWRSQSDRNVADYPWKSWRTILDSENYSSTLDSRYYTESEVNSLLDAKLNRQNLSYGTWNPRGYHLAADYHYNGGDLSISENNGKMYISVDGCFWQNEGQYRVLDTSDISDIRGRLTLSQYLSATDAAWYPLVWGGDSHNNTSDSTGAVYKSYDKLSWQTSSQTLYATNIQTNNIKNLSIGGGIYWNPNVESASDGSDAASITLVRQGVAGGTTLVLSQMNDTNDTIQFKTNTAARLYHNSYPILTTQNTYVSNNKGYIYGNEITQVNNSDKVDNRHAISTTPNTGIIYKAAIYTSSSLTSYWVRLASIPSISQNGEFVATIHVQSGHSNPGRSAILLVYLRGNASSFMSKSFKICCNSNYDPNRFRLYYKDNDKTSEIWYQTTGQWDGIITTVISQSAEGWLYEGLTLYSGSITAVQTPSVSTYLSAQVSTITDNISGNASTATKLQTPRTIWGQSFDGTGNVSGSLSEVGNIHFKVDNSYDIGSDAAASRYIYTHWLGARSGRKLELGANNSGFGQGLCIDTNLNVGIGTNTPAYKLDVKGDIYTTTGFKKNGSSDSYVLLGGGGHKAISDFAISTHTHGLLHSDLTVTLANTTTDSGWSMINSSYNGFLLKSIRTQGSAPNWIENNYAAGICFGGADTKGVVSVAYNRPYIKFAGGNGSKPVWWIRLSGISGATYNLANFNADTLDGVHLNGIFTGFSYAQSKLTATIGTVSKTVNVTGSYPSIGGVTMNTIASYGNCMGMADLASSNSNVNPNNQTSWHHFINMSYNTESTNMWQTQFAIKAGTTEVWVRSRAGGSISDSSAWAAPWVRLARITDNIASATNADMVDGYHENSFLRYRGATYTDQEATLWSQIGIKQYNNALPDNLTGVYNYGSVISLPGFNSRFEIYASHQSSNGNGLYYRSGWDSDKKTWLKFIDSSNIGSQTVANAYHLRINSANTWSTWYWAGQSSQPSWLWGSNDGTNMYVWNPSNFNVNTAQYLRSLGNQNCQTGRTQAYGDVYSYNTYNGNTGSPTTYSSVIGFGRGIAGTVEIAGGWCNTHLYWRSLRDCCEDWFPWRTVLDSSNYTEFINNYYWANVKISASSSTTTSPTVLNLTATNSIRMGNILLEHTNEINNSANDSIHLNLRNSGNVSLCVGGGKVGIGTMYPSQELYVLGYTHTKGFGIGIQYLSESVLLPIISPGDGYTYRYLEIGRPTKVSCIIADKVLLSGVRGILLKFMQGFDGQIVLLKDLENYGSGNGYFWVMPSGCKIINADNSNILINQNQISNIYDDGRSRFFIYSSKYSAWIEFFCSNIY